MIFCMLEVIQVLEKMTKNIWKTFEKMHIAHDDRKTQTLGVSREKQAPPPPTFIPH